MQYGLMLLIVMATCTTACAADVAVPTSQRMISMSDLEAALELPCPELDYPGDVPLSDVLELIQRHMRDETGLPISFLPDFTELELEGLNSLEEVTVRGILIPATMQSCRSALKIVFDQTDEPALALVPYQGQLLVTSLAKAEAPEMAETRIYFLSDYFTDERLREVMRLPQTPSRSGRNRAATAADEAAHRIGQIVISQTGTRFDSWIDDNGRSQIAVLGFSLVIRQTYEVHRQIDALLRQVGGTSRPSAPASAGLNETPDDPTSPSDETAVAWFLLASSGWAVSLLLIVALWQTSKGKVMPIR